jgi:anti-sigma regulatory factor (Ser/Thr protein kinase)
MKGQDGIHTRDGAERPGAAGELGHELGNVLNGLLGMTELLRQEALRPGQDRWLRAIEQSAMQMRRLVDALAEADRPGFATDPLDGIALLEDTLISHVPEARRRGNRLLLVIEPDLPGYWYCDPCRVRQILDNLLMNAIRFGKAGEVVLEAAAASSTLILKVIDSGPGIRPGAERQLFQQFRQNLHARGAASRGSGLGLYVSQKNARAMHGRICWRARKGGGSVFELRLPDALQESVRHETLRCGDWLGGVYCELELEGEIRRSVRCILARKKVAHGDRPYGGRDRRKAPLRVVIREPQGRVAAGHAIELRAEPAGCRSPVRKSLAMPILESGLVAALMEIVLECRSEISPGGSPG